MDTSVFICCDNGALSVWRMLWFRCFQHKLKPVIFHQIKSSEQIQDWMVNNVANWYKKYQWKYNIPILEFGDIHIYFSAGFPWQRREAGSQRSITASSAKSLEHVLIPQKLIHLRGAFEG